MFCAAKMKRRAACAGEEHVPLQVATFHQSLLQEDIAAMLGNWTKDITRSTAVAADRIESVHRH